MLIELLTSRYPGMRLWLSQRLTAIIMAIYIAVLIAGLLIVKPNSYQAWHAFVSNHWFCLATVLFFICLVMHAWLGVRDVLRDYVPNIKLRAIIQVLVDIALFLYLAWLLIILWGV